MEENEQEDRIIEMTDEEGDVIKTEVLFTYEDEERGKIYAFLIDHSDDTIIIGELTDDDSILILGPDTDDELKRRLQTVYEDFVEQYNAKAEGRPYKREE